MKALFASFALIVASLAAFALAARADSSTIIGYSNAWNAPYMLTNGDTFTGFSVPIYQTYGGSQDPYPNCVIRGDKTTNCYGSPNYFVLNTADVLQLYCWTYDNNGNPIDFPGPKLQGPGTFYASSYGSTYYPTGAGFSDTCSSGSYINQSWGTPYFYVDYVAVLGAASPTNLQAATQYRGEVELTWTNGAAGASGSPTVKGYYIERVSQDGSSATTDLLPPTTSSYIDSGLKPDTSYGYRVRGLLSNGAYTDYTNIAWATTLEPLPAPTLRAVRNGSSVALKWSITSSPYWTVDSSSEIQGYDVYRKMGKNGSWTKIGEVSGGMTGLTNGYSDPSPASGDLDYYGVKAYDQTSESEMSDDWVGSYVDITPPATPVLSARPFFIKTTTNGAVSYTPMVAIEWSDSSDDNDNYNDGTFKAYSYTLYRYPPSGSRMTVASNLNRSQVASGGDFGEEFNDGALGQTGYQYKVGSTYCFSATASDINSFDAQNAGVYSPQNTSAEGAQACATIPNPPSSDQASASVNGVSPVSGAAGTFALSGSGFSPSGNSVLLTPSSATADAGTARSLFAYAARIFAAPAYAQSAGATGAVAYSSYMISNLSSADGASLTFSVPAIVPDGSYQVSVVNASGIRTDTSYVIAVSGHGSASSGSASTDGALSATTSASAVYSCIAGYALQQGHTCYKPGSTTVVPEHLGAGTPSYYCNAGAKLVGNSCVCTQVYCPNPPSPAFVTYTCPAPATPTMSTTASKACLFPTTSVNVPASTVAATLSYACPIGYTVFGTSCFINASPVSVSAQALSGLSAGSVSLAWSDNDVFNVWKVDIERGLSTSTFALIRSVDGGTTSYADSGLVPSTKYYYRTRMRFQSGAYGPYSATASTTTPAAPAAPTALSASGASGSSIALVWKGSAPRYAVYDASTSALIAYVVSTSSAPTYTDSQPSFSYGSQRCYSVASYINDQYRSASTTSACASTLGYPIPGSFKVSASLQGSATLSWTMQPSIAALPTLGASIERSASSSSGFMPIGTVSGTTTVDAGLLAGTTYYYRVRLAFSDGTFGPYTSTTSVKTLVPAKPTASASATSSFAVQLSWTDSDAGIASFDIIDPSYNVVASLSSSSRSYLAVGLLPSTQYCYMVRADINPQNSGSSAQVCATTKALVAPSSLIGSNAIQGQISLSWNNNSATNISGVQVERSSTAATGYVQIATSTGSSYVDAGLSAGVSYWYRVRIAYANGYQSLYATTTAAIRTGVPAKPVLTAAANDAVSMKLSWTDADAGITSFTLYSAPASTSLGWVASSSRSAIDGSLSPSTNHCYFIVATINPINTATSSAACGTTASLTAPKSLAATAPAQGQAKLTWSTNAASGFVGVSVERASAKNGPYQQVALLSSSSVSYIDAGLAPGVAYFYSARLDYGSLGYGPYAATTTLTSLVPAKPSSVTATASTFSSVKMSWADSDAGIASFDILEYKPASTTVASFSSSPRSGIVSSLLPSTTYCFAARSVINSQNVSAPSAQACATTPAGPIVANTAPVPAVANPDQLQTALVCTVSRKPFSQSVSVVGTLSGGKGSYALQVVYGIGSKSLGSFSAGSISATASVPVSSADSVSIAAADGQKATISCSNGGTTSDF